MTTYSRFATLVAGVERGIDLSVNTLNVGALQVGSTLLSQAGVYATYVGTPAGASTSVTITANNPGAAGDVTLTFTGSNTISGEIATWNAANPTNTVALTSGIGTQTPTAGTISLTGGTNAGSTLVGDTTTYSNFTSTSATVAGALMGINTELGVIKGSAITSLTGDITATGPGAAAATLATVNGTPGTYTISTLTVNGKGLVTSASSAATTGSGSVVLATSPTLVTPALGTPSALVGTNITGTAAGLTAGTVTTNANLTGDVTSVGNATTLAATTNATLTTLSGLTTASSLASVGTITSGTWNGTTIGILHGGTGQTTAIAAFDALSPMTTAGDLIYENATPIAARLPIGTAGQVLTVSSGLPAWETPATGGTVTSVGLLDGSTAPIYTISGSPVTTSGTLDFTLKTQTANTVFAGPSSGSAAQPTFRALTAADIPGVQQTLVAGQAFSANTTYCVRWGMNSLSETTDRVYAADYDTTSADKFWVIGMAMSTTAVSIGGNIPVTMLGSLTLGSADTGFVAADAGKPVWLTASGTFSTTAPSAVLQADFKVGIVQSTGAGVLSQIWVDRQLNGIN